MDKNFDLNELLKFHSTLHKVKPQQFSSVAQGVKRRLETTLKRRRSSRLTNFDTLRNLPNQSPVKKLSKAEEFNLKREQRLVQLEKWKAEKARKKKEEAANKKKPFLVGAVRPAPKLEQILKVMPSTSGRVTRSQTRKANTATTQTASAKSFAPDNASFCPPFLKNIKNLPVLFLPSNNKGRVTMVSLKQGITEINLNDDSLDKNNQVKEVKKKTACKSNDVKTNRKTYILTQNGEKQKCFKQGKNKETTFTVESSQPDELESPKPKIRIEPNNNKQSTKVTKVAGKTTSNASNQISRKLSVIELPSDSSTPEKTAKATKSNSRKKIQQKRERLSIIPVTISSEDNSPDERRNTRKSIQGKGNARNKDKNLVKQKYIGTSCITIDSTDSTTEELPFVTSRKSAMSGIEAQSETTSNKPIPNSESSSEEKLRSPKEVPMTPEQISQVANLSSPCIIMSRGKDNARREMRKKLREGLLDEHMESMDSVNHFHRQINIETNRLTEIADHWERIMEQNVLPEFVQETILAAVGQARLLMSQKFQQFASLVERCDAADPSQPLVTPADLQGFWEMVYMQVENIDVRFKKLKELQSRGWAPEQAPVVEKKRKAAIAKTAKPTTTSRIKDMIVAARKAKKEQAAVPPEGSKTFEAGFFSVKSPIRSPTPNTPNKPITLLKAVLSNEAQKASASKSATSFAMVRASMIGKNQDYDYDTMNLIQSTPVDLNATPGRSILKSSTKKNRKSLKMVLFDSSDTINLDSSLDRDISGIQRLESEDSPNSEPENQEVERVSIEEVQQENPDLEKLPLEKENVNKLVRQNAVEVLSPVKTRSQRKIVTPKTEVLQETNNNTTRRSTRRNTIAST